MNETILEDLSFGKKAIRVFMASLQLGPTTIQKIAQKANLPRSSTYLLIEELAKKGLISQTKVGKKSIFTASPPERLLQMAQEKKLAAESTLKKLQAFLPQLQAIYNYKPGKPNVRFYEGFEGVKTILEESLKVKEILVLCSGYDQPVEKKLNQYLNQYFKKIVKKKIKTFEIIGESPDAQEYQKTYESFNNKIKIVPLQKGLAHIDKLIYENSLAVISYPYLNGVVIENKQIVDFERKIFWRLWRAIKQT